MKYKNKKSKRANKEKPCFKKTIYPSEEEAEKGATIIWSRDPSADRSDLHAYECPDGCKYKGKAAYHVGHKSYYEVTLELSNMSGLDVPNRPVA